MGKVQEFAFAAEKIMADAARNGVAHCWLVKVPVDRQPWTSTGIELSAGDRVSIFSAGRAAMAADPKIWVGSHFTLWMRVGSDGEIFRAPGVSCTFRVHKSGQLYLASLFPGDWADRHGALATDPGAYEKVTGSLAALVVRWKIDPVKGLARIARSESPGRALIQAEADRLGHPVITPDGWEYLWSIGESGLFDSPGTAGGEPIIRCRMRDDAAILQRPAHLRLERGLTLRWSWKVEALPSARREDALASHDYLSVAVEFDNGQDLTYMWSAAIPPGSSFRCPISRWTGRETHMVVRSGKEQLGEWVRETRDVWEDYARVIGTPPDAVVAVWLIAVSIFGHGTGSCDYSGLELAARERTLRLI